jgi:hypothetical protein
LSLGFLSSAITMVLQQSEQAPHCFPAALIRLPPPSLAQLCRPKTTKQWCAQG